MVIECESNCFTVIGQVPAIQCDEQTKCNYIFIVSLYPFCFSNNRWATCQSGYFLQGIYRNGNLNDDSWLWNIDYGKCCKPANHPRYYGSCYEQSVRLSFDEKGWSKCNDGYFLTGLYRSICERLYCIETFKCCKMVTSKSAFNYYLVLSSKRYQFFTIHLFQIISILNPCHRLPSFYDHKTQRFYLLIGQVHTYSMVPNTSPRLLIWENVCFSNYKIL